MAVDLFKADFSKISSRDLYQAIEEFTQVTQSVDQRPREGYILDFKEQWGDTALKTVAAFANTFGGLLIIGLSEIDGRPEEIVGIETKGELKTQIASAIATNLFPCPQFEIADCILPSEPTKHLAAIRVRESPTICLLAKKDERNPVYVRVEDLALPADATQLRLLIDKKEESSNSANQRRESLSYLQADFFITKSSPIQVPPNQRTRSDTAFWAYLHPESHPRIEMDLNTERGFRKLVLNHFPGHLDLLNDGSARLEESRRSGLFELSFLEQTHDLERRWRLSSTGQIGFVTQVAFEVPGLGAVWSMSDVAADLTYLLRTAMGFWLQNNYYGEFKLEAAVRVEGITLYRRTGYPNEPSGFPSLFYDFTETGIPFPLNDEAVRLVKKDRGAASAFLNGNYLTISQELNHAVALVLNQLLRELGHVADLDKLEQTLGF